MNSKIKILVDDKEIDYYTFADELRNGDYFFKENGEWYLHKRPTIIEDKKIEKLYSIIKEAREYIEQDMVLDFYNDDMPCELIIEKILRILDKVEEK